MTTLKKIINTSAFTIYSQENPSAFSGIYSVLESFCQKHEKTPGADKTLQNLYNYLDLNKNQWWNIFSEIRNSLFMEEMTGLKVISFNKKINSTRSDADFELEDYSLWDVMSFKAHEIKPIETGDGDKSVKNLAKRIKEKFYHKEGLNFIIIDSLFNIYSQNEPFATYLFEQSRDTRKKIFKQEFGPSLENIIYLDWLKIGSSPTITHIGRNITKLCVK